MANGDPIVIGHPVTAGMVTIDSPKTTDTVKVKTNPKKGLTLIVKSGNGADITLPLDKKKWVMEIREV